MAEKGIHFPKGEGIKIIKQASEATVPDSIYIRAINETYAEVIVVSKSGKRRRIGFDIPSNLGTVDVFDENGDLTKEGDVFLKDQVKDLLNDIDFNSRFQDDIKFVAPSNGYTFGKYANGQTIPSKGKTAKEVIQDALIAILPPTYTAPSASLGGTANTNIEVGTTIDNLNVTGSFAQNDAGAKTAERIFKDNTKVSDTNSFTETIKISTPVTYRYEADYGQGVLKNDSAGNPYPNGRIPAGTISATRIYSPSLKIFYGVAAAGLTNYRSLPSVWNAPQTVTLITGTVLKDFYILVPQGRTVTSVKDVESLGNEIISQFTVSDVNVPDAGGTNQAYKLYKWTAGNPYPSSHSLLIRIA